MTTMLLGVTAALAGCGDGASEAQPSPSTSATSSSAPAPTPERPDPRAAVVDLINTFHLAVDADKAGRACTLLTSQLQGVYARNPGASSCEEGIHQLHDELGSTKLSSLLFAPSDVEFMKHGKQAVISHELIAKRNGTDPDETNSYNLERERGGWKISYIG
ncbi:MAG: hypothetical protein GEV00_00465 [Actinophytocola sp.]|nr:hypothetical protein [Actinophytocola sp.]